MEQDKIASLLDQLSKDIDLVEKELDPLFQHKLDDDAALSQAVPPALAAYAVGSLLFAYLKNEDRDANQVMPELARVKEALEKVDKAAKAAGKAGAKEAKEHTKQEAKQETDSLTVPSNSQDSTEIKSKPEAGSEKKRKSKSKSLPRKQKKN